MNKTIIMLAALIMIGNVFMPLQASAQAPQKMSYQAVIRNSSNELISSTAVGMRISILQGSSSGTAVYTETQTSNTNVNGLASLEIGSGTIISGDFSAINWANGPYFIKTETDPEGGTDYTIIGTSELLSVPYALFSGNGSNGTGNPWTSKGNNIYNNNSGSVGIGTNSPTARLTIQTPINTTGWTHIGGADSIIVSEDIGGVSASVGTNTNHAFRINAGGFGRLHIYPAGDVVVGNNSTGSFGKFTVETPNNSYGLSHLGEGGNILATRMGGTSAGIGTFSNTNMRIFTNGETSIFIGTGTNNVGIGLADPAFKMDIADRIRIRSGSPSSTAGLWLNNPGNSAAIAFLGVKDVDIAGIYGNNAGWGLVMNTNTGDVAIGNQNPVAGYKLSVQGSEYINGTLVTTGDAEVGGSSQVAGNLNVGGNIGVGGTPNVPFEVYSSVPFNPLESWTYYDNGGISTGLLCIQAHGDIMASVYVSTSDARIKNINGISNSAKDLETINALQIKDYTMKDKLQYGIKPFKKVIAQEVEKVYPQVVSSNVGFIPNVYAIPVKIEKSANGLLLSFTNTHSLSKVAKKLQVIVGNETKQFDIISIPSENQVLINAPDLKTDKVFVYGEQVNDFRSVDYEGLSTLNISATQELSKLIKKQQEIIDQQQKQIELQEKRLTALEKKP